MKAPAPKPKAALFLLDAHEAARRGLARLIEAEPDLRVCGEASGVDEALKLLASAAPAAVIVSLEPLDAEGPTAVDRLRWAHPGVPLIVVSLKETGAHGRRMLQAGAAGYVTRALAAREIVPAIRAVLKGGVYPPAKDRIRKN